LQASVLPLHHGGYWVNTTLHSSIENLIKRIKIQLFIHSFGNQITDTGLYLRLRQLHEISGQMMYLHNIIFYTEFHLFNENKAVNK